MLDPTTYERQAERAESTLDIAYSTLTITEGLHGPMARIRWHLGSVIIEGYDPEGDLAERLEQMAAALRDTAGARCTGTRGDSGASAAA